MSDLGLYALSVIFWLLAFGAFALALAVVGNILADFHAQGIERVRRFDNSLKK